MMQSVVLGLTGVATACSLCAAQPSATALVTVDVSKELGAIKPMHSVNNGPSVKKPSV